MRRQRLFSKQDMLALRRLIQEKTGYMPHYRSFLSQAFRRRSYCVEDGGQSNEMLEFIGDQVLSYYTVKIIAQRCGAVNWEGDYTCRIRQGQFSVLKQELLSNEALSKIADDWGVADYLIVGRDDQKNEVHKQTKIKADLLEAIIGMIAVDCKWDPDTLEKVVNKALGLSERIDAIVKSDPWAQLFDIDNAVTKLKELAEKEWCSQPDYQISGPDALGYDKNGDPIWGCVCKAVNDVTGVSVLVWASSKKNAKKAAAYLALCDLLQVQNKYGINHPFCSWVYKNGELKPGEPEWQKA